jgi:SAM-dependent methyltransferase
MTALRHQDLAHQDPTRHGLSGQAAKSTRMFCPACGRDTEQSFLYSKNGCAIWQCGTCGLGRADAAGFDPATYYTGDYFSGRHSDGYADYVGAEDVLRREFAHLVAGLREFRPTGRLLDVGCAYGFLLQEARRFFDVSGIEISEEAAAACRRAGLDVQTGSADETKLARLGPMDVIVLLDVIEHLPDPRGTLELCLRQLNPGGIILLSTGDFGSRYARLAGSRWRLMTPPQHLWFFTPASMRGLARSLGLEVLSFAHPWKLVPLSLVVFQLKRMMGLSPRARPGGHALGLPVNLFDAMRVVLRKPS